MTERHTPGPWEVIPADTPTETRENFISVLCVKAGEVLVARVTEYGHARASETELANARLIAAAPDLLEALEEIEQIIPVRVPHTIRPVRVPHTIRIPHSVHARIKKAIAKAEGKL